MEIDMHVLLDNPREFDFNMYFISQPFPQCFNRTGIFSTIKHFISFLGKKPIEIITDISSKTRLTFHS